MFHGSALVPRIENNNMDTDIYNISVRQLLILKTWNDMKIITLTLLIGYGLCSSQAFAKSTTTTWDSDVVENYLNPAKGSSVTQLTNLDERSRWYYTTRLFGNFEHVTGNNQDNKNNHVLEGSLRIRGVTKWTDDLGMVGDFWLKGQERYVETEGHVTNSFDDLEDKVYWEQYRIGVESDRYGALMYGKLTATWGVFTTDMGDQGLYDTQGDAGGKNVGKILYKNQFDNNMFLAGSYDVRSDIWGMDIGYQTADSYAFLPDSYGIYFSMHNGQPMLENGAANYIIGNVNYNSNRLNSDTDYSRAHNNLYTYTLSAYKLFALRHKMVANFSYSPMDDGETADKIVARKYTTGGLGFSSIVGYQMIPEGGHGWSPMLLFSYDQFGEMVSPELEYWFKPTLRVWGSYTVNSSGQDIGRLKFQWDF